VINENIYIRKSFEEQFILGARYDFTYDNSPVTRSRNLYFRGSVSTSGNLIEAFKLARNDPSGRPFEFFGNIYSQRVKITTELRYYFNYVNRSVATRLFAGVGIPYRNSDILPYVEQYFSGGAYEDEQRPGSKFGFNTFYRQLAAGTGHLFSNAKLYLAIGYPF
jgi:outer membrane protein insertion porin family